MGAKTGRTDLNPVWNLQTAARDKFSVGVNRPASRALPVLRALADWQQSAESFCLLKLGPLHVGWGHFVFSEAVRFGQA
jgi:hypothetical protein